MKDFIYVPYDKALSLIQEGDVLLVRGTKLHSFFIKKLTKSLYSHAALASWHNGDNSILEIVEFHLKTGGVARNLKNIVKAQPKTIDVYRPSPYRYDVEYTSNTLLSSTHNGILVKKTDYDGKAVTTTMRKLTALPYSILQVGLLARGYMFGLRLFNNVKSISDDTLQQSALHICSTSIAYSMNMNGYDLVKNKADLRTEPGHLANSPLLNYLFTLE